MQIYNTNISFAEVPNEISLLVNVAGCKLNCFGCQWQGNKLKSLRMDLNRLLSYVNKSLPLITCVTFMGGEWFHDELLQMLKEIKNKGLKTCLYTGETSVSSELLPFLDYHKTGRWIEKRGGLDSPTTNQRFYNSKNENLTHLFKKGK